MRGAPFWRIKNARFFIHFQTKIREKRDHLQTITPDFSSISKPKIGKNVTISKPKHPVFHPFPNQKSGKRDHFQTKTPSFSSVSKPKFGKNVTISKPKHTYYSFGFRRARIESSCKANAIKLA